MFITNLTICTAACVTPLTAAVFYSFVPVVSFFFMADVVFITEIHSFSAGIKKSVSVFNFNCIKSSLGRLPYSTRTVCLDKNALIHTAHASHDTILNLSEWVKANALCFNLPS